MNHFFIDPKNIQESKILFPADVSHQIVRVLRLKMNATVMVLDNRGLQYEVRLVELSTQQCIGEIVSRVKIETEATTKIHLMVALTQREKFEWILQKCCEIGVDQITPILCERSIQLSLSDFEKKKNRWERILKEAAEQSRRGLIPVLNSPAPIQAAIQESAPKKIIAWEKEENNRLVDIFSHQKITDITLMIGPEGGFSEQEFQAAQASGWIPVSLGQRILRMETAAIVACGIILHLSGDI
jgi:16S rRNA (uracil1498-N3)-methyltransferase